MFVGTGAMFVYTWVAAAKHNNYKWVNISILWSNDSRVNPVKPKFTIAIFIHYKTRIAIAILDL